MNKYIQRLINEQFNIGNMDLNNKSKNKRNIFNKNIVDPYKILNDKIKQQMYNYERNDKYMLTNDEITELNGITAAAKIYTVYELKTVIYFYQSYYPKESLNWLDVSQIRDMSTLFKYSIYNGDISMWDVSNVTDMESMFMCSSFNDDISQWDVSNVTNMACMFTQSAFNGNISGWDVSHVRSMEEMFSYSGFTNDISNWDVSHVMLYGDIFLKCSIPENHKPEKFR